MAGNPHRGEVELVVGDRTYVVRPTMDLLARMEKSVDGLPRLFNRLVGEEQNYSMSEVATMVSLATGENLETVFRWFEEHGLPHFVGWLIAFLTAVMFGRRRNDPGEGEAGAATAH